MKTIIHIENVYWGKIIYYDDGTRENIKTPEPLQNILKRSKLDRIMKSKKDVKVNSKIGQINSISV